MIRVVLALFSLAQTPAVAPKPEGAVRFATFNASLNRDKAGGLIQDLSTPDNAQASNVAEIIQRVRPDVLLINEFDYDAKGQAVASFQTNYLGVGHHGAEPIKYPHVYFAEVNTGVPSGVDLDGDGSAESTPGSRKYGNDALGYGQFPGQYGMVLYSMFPIETNQIRTFGKIVWKTMPDAKLPTRPDGSPWYSPEALKVLRVSSKSHWDVPIKVGSRVIHLLLSHPTPPAFDGPEHRNVNRNHDEIRLWADYLTGGSAASYLGAAHPPETFVILGDLNADPVDGGGVPGAIDQLLKHPRVASVQPLRSEGAAEASKKQGEINTKHKGDPALDTADFADTAPGNLRVDYALPSKDLSVLGSGVFWPVEADPLSRLVKMKPVASSDHRLVYLDVKYP
jgi:3-phytase